MNPSYLLLCLGMFGLQNALSDADAQGTVSGDVTVSSMLIDRGEVLSRETVHASLGGEWSSNNLLLYGGIDLIDPYGTYEQAFDQEVDYTLGIAWMTKTYAADVSVNWLTYPGEEADESLEIASKIVFNAPLSPTLLGFYDAHFDNWGLEVTTGPARPMGSWTLYMIGRAGFVAFGDGSETRNYAGLEAGVARPINDKVEIGLHARLEWADEESFANDIRQGQIISSKAHGAAVGVHLSAAF